jgi:hypothetical protein
MEALFTLVFRRFVKKQSLPLQLVVQDEVDRIITDPDIGEGKKGNLTGFRVHKFRFHRQEYLIAYEAGDEHLLFIMIGPHENFYRDLKNYQREY